jgi:hypothetical protein
VERGVDGRRRGCEGLERLDPGKAGSGASSDGRSVSVWGQPVSADREEARAGIGVPVRSTVSGHVSEFGSGVVWGGCAMSGRAYLTVKEAAERFCFPNEKAFHSWLHRRRRAGRNVKVTHCGKKLLFKLSDLEAAMPVERAPKKRPDAEVEAI